MNYFFAVALVFYFIIAPLVQAAESVDVEIRAVISESCSLDVPTTVSLRNIPTSSLIGKENGSLLNDYSQHFSLSGYCGGTNNFKYSFSSENVIAKCLATDKDFMGFCLKVGGNELDMSTGRADYLVTDGQTEINIVVTPQVTGGSVVAGEINSSINITISPI